MRQKLSALGISLLAAICIVNAINRALPARQPVPPRLQYDRTVTLTGSLSREFDMAFVDGSLAPTKDADAAEKVAGEELRDNPSGTPVLRAPIPHLILRLDKPITVQKNGNDGFPAEQNITEIDLGDVPYGRFQIYADSLDNGRHFAVTGTLSHSSTDHHLRAITLNVADIRAVAQ
ncbi:MAG TPA: hypothetical protein VG733_13475 [Chthoniobacteraceae bacterium]|nr:hypothetical protein [Chthoniobacteraceae bacterium]